MHLSARPVQVVPEFHLISPRHALFGTDLLYVAVSPMRCPVLSNCMVQRGTDDPAYGCTRSLLAGSCPPYHATLLLCHVRYCARPCYARGMRHAPLSYAKLLRKCFVLCTTEQRGMQYGPTLSCYAPGTNMQY
eukprot:471294-Rhodomonas_salina.1